MPNKKGWTPFDYWPLEGREDRKPRDRGITMVFDKGLGPSAFEDLLELGGEYIDFIKLGFGSAASYRWEQIRDKIVKARRYEVEVYSGGTLTEIAYTQDKYDAYLEKLLELDVRWVEVSDGTVPIPSKDRRQMINRAIHKGFKVLTEVGKKDPKKHLALPMLVQQAIEDLSDGATYVIVEGRESGKGVNLYDESGKVREDDMEKLVSSLPANSPLLWEAPLKEQQQEMIMRFGPNVNLGNVAPADVIALECLRKGLRSDTLKETLGKKGYGRFYIKELDEDKLMCEESRA